MKTILFLALSLAVFSEASLAGVVNGGGGKGLLCGDQLRVLDLYEGELQGYPVPTTSGDFDTDFKKFLVKYMRQFMPNMSAADLNDPSYGDRLLESVKPLLVSKIVDIPAGETLDFTDDATLPPLPPGCSFVQIAVNEFFPVEDHYEIRVHRDRNLWDKLAPVHQVALLMHEYIYWMARAGNTKINSDDTRVLIARMFSDLETYEMFSPLWGKSEAEMKKCFFIAVKPDKTFESHYAFATAEMENGASGTAFYFAYLNGNLPLARTRAFIPGLRPEDLVLGNRREDESVIENALLARSWRMKLTVLGSDHLQLNISDLNGVPSPYTADGNCNWE